MTLLSQYELNIFKKAFSLRWKTFSPNSLSFNQRKKTKTKTYRHKLTYFKQLIIHLFSHPLGESIIYSDKKCEENRPFHCYSIIRRILSISAHTSIPQGNALRATSTILNEEKHRTPLVQCQNCFISKSKELFGVTPKQAFNNYKQQAI